MILGNQKISFAGQVKGLFIQQWWKWFFRICGNFFLPPFVDGEREVMEVKQKSIKEKIVLTGT